MIRSSDFPTGPATCRRTQLLISGALKSADIAHGDQAIQRNAQGQARLVESLLDFSRVLTGKLELNSEVLDLASIGPQLRRDLLCVVRVVQSGNENCVRTVSDTPKPWGNIVIYGDASKQIVVARSR